MNAQADMQSCDVQLHTTSDEAALELIGLFLIAVAAMQVDVVALTLYTSYMLRNCFTQ